MAIAATSGITHHWMSVYQPGTAMAIPETELQLLGSDFTYFAEIGANELGEGGLLPAQVGHLEDELIRILHRG